MLTRLFALYAQLVFVLGNRLCGFHSVDEIRLVPSLCVHHWVVAALYGIYRNVACSKRPSRTRVTATLKGQGNRDANFICIYVSVLNQCDL